LIEHNATATNVDVTEAWLDQYFDQFRKLGLKLYSEDQRYFHEQLASLNPAEVEALDGGIHLSEFLPTSSTPPS
jgi:hypothetical protein